MKTLFAIFFVLFFSNGCTTNQIQSSFDCEDCYSSGSPFSNDEYIWEDWNITTNTWDNFDEEWPRDVDEFEEDLSEDGEISILPLVILSPAPDFDGFSSFDDPAPYILENNPTWKGWKEEDIPKTLVPL